MGWASGSRIAEELWAKLQPYFKDDKEKQISKIIVELFEREDADDWDYFDDEGVYLTYLKLNKPKEYKELLEDR